MDSDAITQFVSVTGADAQQAAHFLEASKGDLNAAVAAFFATQEAGPSGPSSTTTAGRSPSPAVPVETPRPTPRIATFASTANSSDKDKNTYYAGGEKSGVAVQGPPEAGKPPTSVDEIMKLAAQGGPRPPADSDDDGEFDEDEDEEGDRKPKVQAFTGQGFRLGTEGESSSASSSSTPAVNNPAAPTKAKKVTRMLTFWQDGFSIDDGPLYPFSDPQSQQILEALKSGRAPLHVLNVQPGQPVDLRVAHKPTELYKPPPPKPFSGQGNRLGSLIPGDPTPSTSSSSAAVAAPHTAPAPTVPATLNVTVDQSQPITTLQIRLADGTRMVTKFNHSHTVGQLRAIVAAARSDSIGRSFTLSTTFPMKVLTDDAQTLEQAGLLNSVVVQKWA